MTKGLGTRGAPYLQLLLVARADDGRQDVGEGFPGKAVQEAPQLRHCGDGHVQHLHQLRGEGGVTAVRASGVGLRGTCQTE